MKYIISLIVCVFYFNFIEGQNENAEPFNSFQAYDEYFEMPRESLYLHLNKSTYLRGEHIWFQGYAYNRKTKSLNSSTRNVELGIYDNEGKVIDKKLFLTKNGLFTGQIAIDSSYADGHYYLKAETKYMKNFKEDYAHIQQFEILGEELYSESQAIKDFDLQILPEGGHSVVNCSGNLGIKLINSNGAGMKFIGKLFEDNISIMDFKSNQFGLAKVKILPKESKTYHIEVTLPNGKTIKQNVENIKSHGYLLNVNNQIPNKTIVQISSYLPKGYNYKASDIKLVVRQEGKKFIIPLYFSEEISQISKVIRHDQLFKGVNTLTLFLNDMPIAERLIFNNNDLLDHYNDIEIVQEQSASKDSLSFEISLPDLETEADLSVSVLPEGTISYVKNQNISSAFLLEPFVHGYIENKPYYFSNTDRKVKYNLDLLLLTQGWSQYSWDNILSGPVQDIRLRTNGLTQNIILKNKVRKNPEELILYNTIHNDGIGIKVRKDSIKEFQIHHRYPIVGETMQFFFNGDKENLIKPDLEVNTELQFQNDNLSKELLRYPIKNLRNIKPEISTEQLYDSFINEQKLDTVFLSSKTKKQKKFEK